MRCRTLPARLGVLVLLAGLSLAMAAPAAAHALRVFARAEAGQVSGYGFFIGGGRAAGVVWTARAGETLLAEGHTDAGGGFAFALPPRFDQPVVITLDTRDGHMARADIAAGGSPQAAVAGAIADPGANPGAAPDTAAIAAAVAHEVAPLMERIDQMDARLRLTDALSGIFLILGLAGMALWARGRRR